MKAIFKVTAVAALMAGAVSMAHAAPAHRNADVEITGNIVNYTCDLSIPQSHYDLGNHTADEFGTFGTPPAPEEVGAKQFLLEVKDCAGSLAAKQDLSLQVNQTGADNVADAANFWGDDGGTHAGIILKMKTGTLAEAAVTPANNTYKILVGSETAETPLAGQAFPVVVTAAMKAAAVPLPGALKANLQFTMAE